MKIKQIKIKNWRSFKNEVKVVFNSNLNILIGPNSGGKSNLLDIITIILKRYFLLEYQIKDDQRGHGFVKIIERMDLFDNTEHQLSKYFGCNDKSFIKITFEVEEEDINNIKIIRQFKSNFVKKLSNFDTKPY